MDERRSAALVADRVCWRFAGRVGRERDQKATGGTDGPLPTYPVNISAALYGRPVRAQLVHLREHHLAGLMSVASSGQSAGRGVLLTWRRYFPQAH